MGLGLSSFFSAFDGDPTKRLPTASAGSEAGAESGVEIRPDLGAPFVTEGPVQAAASVESEAPVETGAPTLTGS